MSIFCLYYMFFYIITPTEKKNETKIDLSITKII